MTNHNLITLLQAQRGMVTCKVHFNSDRSYTYKVPPKMTLVKDDLVAVPANGGLKVGIVAEVDDFADVDLDSGIVYLWVVDRIDRTTYDALLKEEKEVSKRLHQAEAMEKLNRVAAAAGINLESIETPMLIENET